MKFTKTVVATVAIGASLAAYADGVEWNGFGSLYYSQAMDNNFLVGGNANNKPNYTQHSLFGLNVGSRLSDEFSVASQIVMAGGSAQATNFNMFAQWAYLNYRPMPGLNLKIGRQLSPFLISSEYQRVHFLLPQANIPGTVYGLLPFVSFDGASVNKTFDVGIGSLTVGAYSGNPKLNTPGVPGFDLDFQTLTGVRASLDGSGWRLHATANRAFSKVTYDANSFGTSAPVANVALNTKGTAKTNSNIFTFGYRFDKFNFVSWGEATYNKGLDKQNLTLTTRSAAAGTFITSSTKQLFEKAYGGYVLAGYRMGKFLPTVTYARGTTYLGLPANSATNQKFEGQTTSYIAALAYQPHDQVIVRTEFLRTYVPSIGGGWQDVAQSSTSKRKFGDAVKAGVDFIF